MLNINLVIPWEGSIAFPLMDFFHIFIANTFEKKISQMVDPPPFWQVKHPFLDRVNPSGQSVS